MPQQLKPAVKARIAEAALTVFARRGFAAATMSAIASAAGISTGNTYRYFGGKGPLFDAVVPAALAERLTTMLERRVGALDGVAAIDQLGADAPFHLLAEELLGLCIAHRRQVVILLSHRADGTRHEGFGERTVARLVALARRYRRTIAPGRVTDRGVLGFALEQIYRGFVAGVVDALASFDDEPALRTVIAALERYHLAGLHALLVPPTASAQPQESR